MPHWDFQCGRCGNVKDVHAASVEQADLSYEALCDNPLCDLPERGGSVRMTRQAAAPSFVLKGAGFHSVDYPTKR